MALDFSRRSSEPEWMDADDDVDFQTFRGCLHDLAQVNRVTLAHRPTLAFLEQLRRQGRLDLGRSVRIVDVGAGYGDLLRMIAGWAVRKGVSVQLTGLDLNPWSARAAAAATPPGAPIKWVTGDVFDRHVDCDLVVSALFTHHLDDDQLVRFLGWMQQRAMVGWFINDLYRHPAPYFGFQLLARLVGWHPFVRHDGPVSIARAFTESDWRGLLARAGLPSATARIQRRFPFRLCVSSVKAVP